MHKDRRRRAGCINCTSSLPLRPPHPACCATCMHAWDLCLHAAVHFGARQVKLQTEPFEKETRALPSRLIVYAQSLVDDRRIIQKVAFSPARLVDQYLQSV